MTYGTCYCEKVSRRSNAFFQNWQMLQKMILQGGKQTFMHMITQYNQSLFDNMGSENMLKVEKTRILSGSFAWNCPDRYFFVISLYYLIS